MKIATKIVLDMETLEVLERQSFEYHGPVDRLCGASGDQKSAFADERKLSDSMTSDFEQFFGQDSAMLNEITSNLTPIQQAGPSQFGLSPTAEAAERTAAVENLTAAGAQATNAVRSAMAAQGGGTTYLPSGSEAAIVGNLAQQQATQQALAQNQITQQGYQLGRENWLAATQGLEAAPGAFQDPVTGMAKAATGAAGQTMEGANAITAANQAWMQPVASIVGGVLGGPLGGLMSGGGGGSQSGGNGPQSGAGSDVEYS